MQRHGAQVIEPKRHPLMLDVTSRVRSVASAIERFQVCCQLQSVDPCWGRCPAHRQQQRQEVFINNCVIHYSVAI